MTRHEFAHEGEELTINRIIEVGALKWIDDEEIPVVWQFNYSDLKAVMGRATDLQRDDDGWISAEIAWHPDRQDLVDHELDKSFFLTFYANEVASQVVDGVEHIKSARLRCVSAILDDPWKGIRK